MTADTPLLALSGNIAGSKSRGLALRRLAGTSVRHMFPPRSRWRADVLCVLLRTSSHHGERRIFKFSGTTWDIVRQRATENETSEKPKCFAGDRFKVILT